MIGLITQEDLDELVKYINDIATDVKKLREDYNQLVVELKDELGKSTKEEDEDVDIPEDELEEDDLKPIKLKKRK